MRFFVALFLLLGVTTTIRAQKFQTIIMDTLGSELVLPVHSIEVEMKIKFTYKPTDKVYLKISNMLGSYAKSTGKSGIPYFYFTINGEESNARMYKDGTKHLIKSINQETKKVSYVITDGKKYYLQAYPTERDGKYSVSILEGTIEN